MEVSWIKLKTDTFSDEKIRLIETLPEGDGILVILFKLWTQAGKCNKGGYVTFSDNMGYTPEMLSTIYNKPLPIVRHALKTLQEFGMIQVECNGMIFIPAFGVHQEMDKLEKIREQNRERVAKFRQNQRAVTLQVTQGNGHIRTDQKRLEENKVDIPKGELLEKMFNEFWNLYPRKVAKQKSFSSFKKIENIDQDKFNKIIKALKEQKDSLQWQKDNGQFIPYPSTWLNQERWDDQLPPVTSNNNPNHQLTPEYLQ